MPRVPVLALASIVAAALPAHIGALELDPAASHVSLVSTKVLAGGEQSAAERFLFEGLSGQVSEDGAATVAIDLDTISTGVDIRDERMAEFLFQTEQYPQATITATVPPEAMQNGNRVMDLPIEVGLHGGSVAYTVPVQVSTDEVSVRVTAIEPVLVNAADYTLEGGLAQLAGLAKLMHIPVTVPVSFSLSFER